MCEGGGGGAEHLPSLTDKLTNGKTSNGCASGTERTEPPERLHVPAAEMRLQNGADVRANERTLHRGPRAQQFPPPSTEFGPLCSDR